MKKEEMKLVNRQQMFTMAVVTFMFLTLFFASIAIHWYIVRYQYNIFPITFDYMFGNEIGIGLGWMSLFTGICFALLIVSIIMWFHYDNKITVTLEKEGEK